MMKRPLEQFPRSSQTINVNQSFRKDLKANMIALAMAALNILILSIFRNEDIDHLPLTWFLLCFDMIGTSFFKASGDG
jgi:hypothetical protein